MADEQLTPLSVMQHQRNVLSGRCLDLEVSLVLAQDELKRKDAEIEKWREKYRELAETYFAPADDAAN